MRNHKQNRVRISSVVFWRKNFLGGAFFFGGGEEMYTPQRNCLVKKKTVHFDLRQSTTFLYLLHQKDVENLYLFNKRSCKILWSGNCLGSPDGFINKCPTIKSSSTVTIFIMLYFSCALTTTILSPPNIYAQSSKTFM